MKCIVIFTVYIFCFISTSTGLKCYECNDVYQRFANCSSDPLVKVCDETRTLCATAVVKSGQSPYRNCDDENSCTLKDCVGPDVCTEPGTFEYEEVGLGNFTLTCCEGDLCNNFSSAHLCKKNLLLNVLFVSLFLFAS